MYDGSEDYETGWETAPEKETCPQCGADWSVYSVLPGECPECGADTAPF